MIFLAALKIIGLVFLFIIALFFGIIFLALFSSLRYDIDAMYDKTTEIRAKISWIFGLIRFRYCADDKPASLKILFFEVLKEKKKNKEKRNSKLLRIKKKKISNADEPPSREEIGKGIAEPKAEEPIKKADAENSAKKPESETTADKSKNEQEKPGLFSRAGSALRWIKDAIERPDSGEIIACTKKLIVKLAKALGVRIFWLNTLIGFEDPATTGEAIALICILRSATGLDIRAEGDFENQIFALEARAAGKTTLWRLCWPLLVYIINKPIWNLIKNIRKGRE